MKFLRKRSPKSSKAMAVRRQTIFRYGDYLNHERLKAYYKRKFEHDQLKKL